MAIKIQKATLDDLKEIQKLNHKLFKLEKECFDPTLIADWPLSQEGEKYFKDLINNQYVIIALNNTSFQDILCHQRYHEFESCCKYQK